MKYYLAPLEGITGYVYRNAYHKFFEPADKYFTPFLAPNKNGRFSSREKNDIAPEHNQGMYTVPQLLTNQADDFITTANQLKICGYEEINLNLGCPSKTVVHKFRGAGFLEDPDAMDRFFDKIFSALDVKISVKTRIGMDDPCEFEDILAVYNRYPLAELIIHPRIQKEFYGGTPHLDVFAMAATGSKAPVCYNGDIFTESDYETWHKDFPSIDALMMGRGILQTPGILGAIKGKPSPDISVLHAFHEELFMGYQEVMPGEHTVLFKMKEFWSYFQKSFPENKKALKKIKKAQTYDSYREGVELMFQCE